MRPVLVALVVLLAPASACVAESTGAPAVRHPMAAPDEVVCADEAPTGSSISRPVCRETPSPGEQAISQMLREVYPPSPLRGGAHATDTPGLQIYR